MAKKKVKKYHQGGSHEDHHVQSAPVPQPIIEEKKAINQANQKKATRVPAYAVPEPVMPIGQFQPFRPTERPQPITVGGPKQVQPMPSPQIPKVVGVTPQPLQMLQLPSNRLVQDTANINSRLANMFNASNKRRGTASRVNPNAILGNPLGKPKRKR